MPLKDVDEVSQQVFLKAYRALARYRGEAPFAHWLAKIAVSRCHDYWRAAGRRREVDLSQEGLERVVSAESKERFTEAQNRETSREILEWAMSKLSPDDRMVLTLVYIEEHSEKEAAELLGWSPAKVKGRVFRTRQYLQKLLAKHYKSRLV